MKIPNISLGFSNKKYSHNLSRDCNTTFTCGVVQPIFTQYMMGDSDIKVSARQSVRLSPLVAPSFARLSLKTVTRFVPEHDVVPWADAFYSKSPYRGSVRDKLPYTNNATLLYYVLLYSNFTAYKINTSGGLTYIPFSDTFTTSTVTALLTFLRGSGSSATGSFPSTNYVADTSDSAFRPVVTPDNADFVFQNTNGNAILCFKFGSKAKRLRSIFLGLGYSLDAYDRNPVRLSPILSFYKMYFDTYGIKRNKNFTQTACANVIYTYIDSSLVANFTLEGSSQYGSKLDTFISELADCYYSVAQNFVSIHRDKLQNNSVAPVTVSAITNSSASTVNVNSADGVDPRLNSLTNTTLTNVSLQVLQRLSRFTNKNSILGQRLSQYMKLHYGVTSVNSIFDDSNFIDSSSMPCPIDDVFSTSDTVVGDDGEHLGAYAGKGYGQGDLHFKFHASCPGYVITLAAIVPDAGFWQGNSTDLFAVNWEQQPSADFDALGMEATPRGAFFTYNDICDLKSNPTGTLSRTFGFVPRFSGFKFAKNLVNGDMSLRSSIETLSPYYLDYIIASSQIETTFDSTGKVPSYHFKNATIPSSSEDWRLVGKYPWLGNFNRIFVNDTNKLSFGSYIPSRVESQFDYDMFCVNDPYMSQCIFNCTVRNSLKPLSLSYDTFEESTDTASTDVSAS